MRDGGRYLTTKNTVGRVHIHTVCSHADTDILKCINTHTHIPEHESGSIAITVQLCRNLVSNDWWDRLRAKKKGAAAVVFACACVMCLRVQQQSFVSL